MAPSNLCSSSGGPSPSSPQPITGNTVFVGFWESWADTVVPMSTIPSSVNVVDVAFSTGINGGTLLNPQNTNPIDAATIHSHGGKILLSFGGASGTGAYAALDPNAFVSALATFMNAHPGTYDGVDFDDEADPRPPQPLISVILATRAQFPPPFLITYDAFPSGADTGTDKRSDWQGSDIAVASAVSGALDWVEIMDYNFGSWRPTNFPNCMVAQTAPDDCRRDVLSDFSKIYPNSKIVMGLEVPSDDNGIVGVTPADVAGYAAFVKSSGYRGLMMWDLKRDTGFAYTSMIATKLQI
jgi:chitinase